MAFSSEVTRETVFGNVRIKWGTFTTSSTETGGDIETGLTRVHFLVAQHSGDAAVASSPSVNETFPLSGGDVTIVTTESKSGYWFAIGDG